MIKIHRIGERNLSININKIAETDLSFRTSDQTPISSILITSQPDADAVADGETEPFDWMDLRYMDDAPELLIDADEIVLKVDKATLVLDYPLETPVTRHLCAENGVAFTRGELMKLIAETYGRVYELEANSQSSPTPEPGDREGALNRPGSDGEFGIYGHDYSDLGVSSIDAYEVSGKIWLVPEMES